MIISSKDVMIPHLKKLQKWKLTRLKSFKKSTFCREERFYHNYDDELICAKWEDFFQPFEAWAAI